MAMPPGVNAMEGAACDLATPTARSAPPVAASTEPVSLPIGLLSLEKVYAIADSGAGEATSDVRVLTYTG